MASEAIGRTENGVNGKRGPYSSPRQQARRQRILHCATSLLEKQGRAALSMQSIAQHSSVSTKTLYNLFGNLDRLLLDAAALILEEQRQSAVVTDEPEGIDRLITYSVGTMVDFQAMPEAARAMVSILVRAELDADSAYERFGPMQRYALQSLTIARQNGELVEGVDIEQLSYQISAHQWGAVLLWEKGLLELEQLASQVRLNLYLTLAPICTGERAENLQSELCKLLRNRGATQTSNKHATAS